MNDRQLVVVVEFRQTEEVQGAHVEVIPPGLAGQINLRGALGKAMPGDMIIAQESAIGQGGAVKAPEPALVDVELALRLDHAAEVAVAGQAGEFLRIGLIDAGGADLIRAVFEPVAEFAFHHDALIDERRDRHGRIHVRADRPEIGHLESEAGAAVRIDMRRQEAGLPLHGRIGMIEIGQVSDRYSEQLDRSVLIIDRALAFVVDDLRGLDLPERRLLRIVAAGFAGGVNAVREYRDVAFGAVRARRGEAGALRRFDEHRIDESFAEVLRHLQRVGVDDVAVLGAITHVAFGEHLVRDAVIGDLVGFEHGAIVIDLDAADRMNPVVLGVVDHLVGGNEHLGVGIALGLLAHEAAGERGLRALRARQRLREGNACESKAERHAGKRDRGALRAP
jgi:hypothetical protein